MFSCSITKMLPSGAALKPSERTTLENKASAIAVEVQTENAIDFPIIPFQIFGVTYSKDIVIVTKNPKWNMHEYAKLEIGPNQSTWLMKDSEEGSLTQFLTTSQSNLISLLPEIPLETSIQDFVATEKSSGDTLEAHFEYINHLGEKVVVDFKNTKKLSIQKKRNGSTMGHSRNQVMAILDLPLRQFSESSSVSYDGIPFKTKKILGLLPFQMLLTQTQGGLSVGDFKFFKDGNLIKSLHLNSEIEQVWTLEKISENKTILKQQNEFRTQVYEFTTANNQYLLSEAYVKVWNSETPTFKISFFPPLPDLRFPFEQKQISTFVMDVNGQQNHGTGTFVSYWNADKELKLEINPSAPNWLKERPMLNTIRFDENGNPLIKCEMLNIF